jgi:hypothetical protein
VARKLKRFEEPIGLVPKPHRAKDAPDSLLDFISVLNAGHAKTLAIGVAFSVIDRYCSDAFANETNRLTSTNYG